MDNAAIENEQEAKKDERFLRQGFLDSFIEFVKSTSSKNQSYVVAVDGVYGSGKSFFLKRFEESIYNNKYPTLLMNAWEDEIHQNPLFSILLNLFIFVNEKNIPGISKEGLSRGVTSALGNIGNDVSKKFFGIDFKKIYSEANNELNSKEDKIIYELLLEIIKEKKCVDYFEDALVDFPKKDAKLIIIVDELDRCSPTYAIRFLETLHHFFKIPNVTFVLGINKKQIEISVKKIYGYETDTEEYLRKFIDRTFHLTAVEKKLLQEYLKDQFSRFDPSIEIKKQLDEHIDFVSILSIESFWVLRQMNQYVNDYLDYILRDNQINFKPVYYYAAAFYLWTKIKNEKLAQSIHDNTFKPTEVIKVFNGISAIFGATGILDPFLDCLLKNPCDDNTKKEILDTAKDLKLNMPCVNRVLERKSNNFDGPESVVYQVAKSIEEASVLSKLLN